MSEQNDISSIKEIIEQKVSDVILKTYALTKINTPVQAPAPTQAQTQTQTQTQTKAQPRVIAAQLAGDRFSMTRMMNFKSTGGCRACS